MKNATVFRITKIQKIKAQGVYLSVYVAKNEEKGRTQMRSSLYFEKS